MAKNIFFLNGPKIESFLCGLWTPLGPPFMGWPTTGAALQKSQMEQIYAYDFVTIVNLGVLTIF